MSRYDALLLDLDGTLLDSFELILESFHYARHKHFGDRLSDAFWAASIGTTLRDQFGTMARSPDELEALIASFKEHNLANHDAHVHVYDGAAEVTKAAKAAGLKVALVTSKMRAGAEMGVRFLGLEDTFEFLVCGDDVKNGKPDPEPVFQALRRLAVKPERAAFVGDSPHDLKAAKSAGVDGYGASWGPFDDSVLLACEPAGMLETVSDIRSLFE